MTDFDRRARVFFAGLAAAFMLTPGAHGGEPASSERVTHRAPSASRSPGWLVKAYSAPEANAFWTQSRRNHKRLETYLEVLESADRYGFDREDYAYSWLRSRAERRSGRADRALELTASMSLAEFARDIRDGRTSPRIDLSEDGLSDRDVKAGDIFAAFQRDRDPKHFLAAIRRDNPVQKALLGALSKYEALQRAGGWEPVALAQDKIELGDAAEEVIQIGERLRAEGFYAGRIAFAAPAMADGQDPGEALPVYDETLEAALKAFQRSRGIEPDGIVGPETISEMNVPVERLLALIKLNMERARWLPQDFDERYILVNIAGLDVGMYRNERREGAMRVVVGKDHQQTPTFAGSMSYVVVNPYWNVPTSILRREIAPKARQDASYLTSKRMEAVRGWGAGAEILDPDEIDWDNAEDLASLRVRQKPGPANSLGLVKFMFPNDYNVYLHDTPADALFAETDRAFSHGCIRLEKPLEMARWVWRDAPADARSIDELVAAGERATIPLEREIPVYIGYFTAWADPDGGVHFYPDVYDRDQALAASLRDLRSAIAQRNAMALTR